MGNKSRYRVSLGELERSTGHARGERLAEVEADRQVPPSEQTDVVPVGAYTALLGGGRPVFSVEKPPPGIRRVILTLGALGTVAGITLVVLALMSSR